MPRPAPVHRCRLLAAPWPGVHVTDLESGRHFGRHAHDTFGVGWLVDGAQQSASGRGEVDAYAGDLIATNPGEVHDGRPLGTDVRRWRMLYLDAAAMADALGTSDLAIVRPVMRDGALARALAVLFDRVARGAAPLACEEALVAACAALARSHTTVRPAGLADTDADPPVARAAERLAADGPAPTLADLAALTGVGRFQLLRRFTRVHGLPPHAWWLQRRVEQARALIARGVPLADAALASGFADQSHLTRAFGRQHGFTPGAWRRATTA